jgi:predicted nuclease of predicted toxin-antitoxin system
VKLYLDEDVNINLAVRLRGYGYNVVTTLEVGNLGNPDEKQLEYAANNDRVLLTHNRRDFRRLHRDWIHRAQYHCGIIVSVHINLEELERRMLTLLMNVSAEQARGMLFSLSDFI